MCRICRHPHSLFIIAAIVAVFTLVTSWLVFRWRSARRDCSRISNGEFSSC
jgi:hypothetical protein